MLEKRSEAYRAKIKFKLLMSIFVFLIVFSIYMHSQGFDLDYLKEVSESKYGFIIFILLYATTSFIPIPFTPTSFAVGLFFPIFSAFSCAVLGSMLFSTIMFYITRLLGKEYVDLWMKKHKKFYDMDLRIKKNGFFDIFLLRLFFVIPSEFINILAGLSEIRFRDFFYATFLGNLLPLFFSVSLMRAGMHKNFVGIAASLLGLFVVLVIPLFFVSKIKKMFTEKINSLNMDN